MIASTDSKPREAAELRSGLYHELDASLDKKIQTDMIILDYSKAFDPVPHQRLLKKVVYYVIGGTPDQWFS